MKFERAFQWSIKYGARILFAFAILFAIGAVVTDAILLAQKLGVEFNDPNGNVTTYTPAETLILALLAPFTTSMTVLFSALVVNHLDRWATDRRGGPR